jgi:hypothetical protein
MTKHILSFVICFFVMHSILLAQFNIGAGLTYLERNNDVGLQAKAVLGLAEKWAVAAGGDLILTKGTKFDINTDVQYRITLGDFVRFNPLAGLNFTKRTDVSAIDIGINLGLFSFIPLQERLNLYIEPKLTVGSLNSFVLSAGVMF